MGSSLTASDREQLDRRGIAAEEVERQLALFRAARSFTRLVRPCTVGDGIRRIEEHEIPELLALHAKAADEGRFTKFVPASGAATRMFRELLQFQSGAGRELAWSEVRERADGGDAAAAALLRFIEGLREFAFYDDLRRVLLDRGQDPEATARQGDFPPILDALLDPSGLGYGGLPKGLLKFHRSPDGNRTAFEEHLVEAAEYARGGGDRCRLHLTVSPEHRRLFEALFGEVRARYEQRLGARYEIDYSVQKPSTDTIAVDEHNEPSRDDDGRLIFRPGGHGALIENLNDLGGDLVYVKNIDNVQPDHRKPLVAHWKRILGGYLLKLQRGSHAILEGLRRERPSSGFLARAMNFTGTRLQVELNGRFDSRSSAARRAWLIDRLSRPLRVCGVVPNTGEPGGGPFWVRDRRGAVSLQIVETAQIDPQDAEQQELLRRSTHFNPVDLVCAVRDAAGRAFDLTGFVDPSAVIVSDKSAAGRSLRALELPGLWNGAMAAWNTVFVEVPLETFSPVKTVLDLLRPEHQPGEPG